MSIVIDHKKESSVSGLGNDYALVFPQKSLFKDQMRATARHNSRLEIWLCHLADHVAMHTGAVDHDLGFDLERLATGIHFIYAKNPSNFPSLIFNKLSHLDVISESSADLARGELVHSCGEKTVDAHAAVTHLRLRHHRAVSTMQLVSQGVLLPQLRVGHNFRAADRHIVVGLHQLA